MFKNLYDDITDPTQKLELDIFGEIVEENQLAAYRLKNKLITLRKAKGYTQKQLAERIGISQQVIQQFERYDSDPKLSTVLRYANYVFANLNLDAKPHYQTEWKQTAPKLTVVHTQSKQNNVNSPLKGWSEPTKTVQATA